MGGLGGVDDLPIVALEHFALLVGQPALGVVQDQAGAQRREGGVDVDRVGVAGEVDGVDPVVGEMAGYSISPAALKWPTPPWRCSTVPPTLRGRV